MKTRSLRLMALGLLSILLSVAGLHADQPVLPETLIPSLDAILKQAVKQSPQMINRALDLQIAEEAKVQARASILPSLSASASLYKSEDKSSYLYTSGSDYSNAYHVTKTPYGVSFSQPLYTWGERTNYYRMGQIQESIARGNYRNAYRLFAQTVRTDYLRLIVLKQADARASFYLDMIKTNLALEESRYAKKIISDAQIFSARTSAEQAEIAAERTKLEFENAKASFARTTATPLLDNSDIPDSIPAITHPQATFEQMADGFVSEKEKPTAEAVVARKQLQSELLNYSNQKVRLRPKFSLAAGISQDQQNNLYGTVKTYKLTSTFIGVSMYWTLFDGFTTGATVRTSLARQRQMQNDYKTLVANLEQQARTQVRLLGLTARSMVISDRFLSDSEGNLKDKTDEFKRGQISEADLNAAKLALMDAKTGAYSARIDYLGRVGDFLGTLNADPVTEGLPTQ